MKHFSFLKEYSSEVAKSIIDNISKLNVKEIKGEGTFEVIATSESVDRDGEVIMVQGWDFANFMKNPILLFGHDYWNINSIIGAVTEIIPEYESKRVVARGVFAKTEVGQLARQLYEDGILKTVSVGFIPYEREGSIITRAELLELSFVPVPSNPDALSLSRMCKFAKMIASTTTPESQSAEKCEAITEEVVATQTEEQVTQEETTKNLVITGKGRDMISSTIKLLQDILELAQPQEDEIKETAKSLVLDVQSMQKMLESAIQKSKKVNDIL